MADFPAADMSSEVEYNVTKMMENATQAAYSDPGKDQFNLFKFIVDIFVVGFLCLVGFTGNTLSIAVMRKERQKSTMSLLLTALAVMDNLFLLACLFYQTCLSIYTNTGHLSVCAYGEPYVYAYGLTAQTGTIWIVVMVTMDRFVAVCKPFSAQKWCTRRNAKMAAVGVATFSILYNLPRWFEMGTSEKIGKDGTVEIIPVMNPLFDDYYYAMIYRGICYIIFMHTIPLSTILILNIKMILAVRYSNKRHAHLSRDQNNENNATVMLIMVVTIFLLCETPAAVANILSSVDMHVPEMTIKYMFVITNMLVTLNSSTNFIIYCLFGRRFRRHCLELLCPGKVIQRFSSTRRSTVSEVTYGKAQLYQQAYD